MLVGMPCYLEGQALTNCWARLLWMSTSWLQQRHQSSDGAAATRPWTSTAAQHSTQCHSQAATLVAEACMPSACRAAHLPVGLLCCTAVKFHVLVVAASSEL